jgi:hypothetical protein
LKVVVPPDGLTIPPNTSMVWRTPEFGSEMVGVKTVAGVASVLPGSG